MNSKYTFNETAPFAPVNREPIKFYVTLLIQILKMIRKLNVQKCLTECEY